MLEAFSSKRIYKGLRIIAINGRGEPDLEDVERSLQLLFNSDSLGWQRITRYLSQVSIVNIDTSLGWYWKNLNACFLSPALIKHSPEAEIAAVILHEAVHARLYRWGIRTGPENRTRIEAICMREERRFRALTETGKAGDR